jgi:hypothetical protein
MAILQTDLIDIPIDPVTGDIVITNGRILPTSGFAAVVQGVRRRMLAIAGEWFIDLDFGVRWFERVGVPASAAIFGQKFDQAKCDAEIRKAILSTPAITSIIKLDVAFNGTNRGVTITWQARCAFGDTPVDTLAVGA